MAQYSMRRFAYLSLILLAPAACAGGKVEPGAGGAAGTTAGSVGTPTPPTNPNDTGTTTFPTDPNGTPQGASDGNTLGPGANANLQTFAAMIHTASTQAGVPADLIASVIWAESRADPTVSGGGLMQVDPTAFAQMQNQYNLTGTLRSPQTAILAGAYYLQQMRSDMEAKYNQDGWPIALRAYNSGINGVNPTNLNATPAGTGDPNYVTHVLGYWVIISTGNGALPP